MTSGQGSTVQGETHASQEKTVMLNTLQALDEENETILSEILKCAICLEYPRGKKVRICEKGHHFCMPCHKKMRVCGICRGHLLESRNFVVEELVTKLGPILGFSKGDLPLPQPPPKYTSGSYQCPHNCSARMPAHLVLPHLRSKHKTLLIDNVRSNPFSDQFSFVFDFPFAPDTQHTWSAHVSDMGVFSVFVYLVGLSFYGWAKALGDESLSSQFRYQLVVKVPAGCGHLEFGIGDCEMASYQDGKEAVLARGNFLKVKEVDFLEHISPGVMLTGFFTLWRKTQERKNAISGPPFVPERQLSFPNDRRTRRNRGRNARRKKLREKFRYSMLRQQDDEVDKQEKLTTRFSRVSL